MSAGQSEAGRTDGAATQQIVARDPAWLPHRYDPQRDAVQFRNVTRQDHRAATFLIDDMLPAGAPVALDRGAVVAEVGPTGPLHFIFHSAFCCSTLLARAFDLPGLSMAMKEPVILNDVVGWRRRGARPADVARVLDDALGLLARPFGAGEAMVIKPSNIVAGLMDVMMAMRPQSKALLLHAPLDVYLASVARKGMWGRLWVRELIAGLRTDGLVAFGFEGEDLLRQTDLQVAATGWLTQHALFHRLAAKYGPGRIATLDSEALNANLLSAMTRLAEFFEIRLEAEAVVQGPAFSRHSKGGVAFNAADRAAERMAGTAIHADEIGKVMVWAHAVADRCGLSLALPLGLVE